MCIGFSWFACARGFPAPGRHGPAVDIGPWISRSGMARNARNSSKRVLQRPRDEARL
jgi:hypothetical protein